MEQVHDEKGCNRGWAKGGLAGAGEFSGRLVRVENLLCEESPSRNGTGSVGGHTLRIDMGCGSGGVAVQSCGVVLVVM